jgi:hypothetical protein
VDCRFFDHTHSQTAIKKMKKLAVGRLAEGEGKRKSDLGPGIELDKTLSSGSSLPMLLLLVLVAAVGYYLYKNFV